MRRYAAGFGNRKNAEIIIQRQKNQRVRCAFFCAKILVKRGERRWEAGWCRWGTGFVGDGVGQNGAEYPVGNAEKRKCGIFKGRKEKGG